MEPDQLRSNIYAAPIRPEDVLTIADARRLLQADTSNTTYALDDEILATDYGGVTIKSLIWWNKYSNWISIGAIVLGVIWFLIWAFVEKFSFSEGHVVSFIGFVLILIGGIMTYIESKWKTD